MTNEIKKQLCFNFEAHFEAQYPATTPLASAVLFDLQQIRAKKNREREKEEEQLLMQAIRQSVAHLM